MDGSSDKVWLGKDEKPSTHTCNIYSLQRNCLSATKDFFLKQIYKIYMYIHFSLKHMSLAKRKCSHWINMCPLDYDSLCINHFMTPPLAVNKIKHSLKILYQLLYICSIFNWFVSLTNKHLLFNSLDTKRWTPMQHLNVLWHSSQLSYSFQNGVSPKVKMFPNTHRVSAF